ncbi:MAG TPA: hypothetical protein VNJ03_12090 [Vicinamibacterales bacterium]|nr:hypothetical protein [Vicinamibacterales bacterium]
MNSTKLWRMLAAVAALNVATVGAAAAQTVLVRHAASGETVEVLLNGAPVASGPVGAEGVAKVAFAMPADSLPSGMDARISVDTCDKLRRVHIVERSRVPPAAQDGCNRHEISGLYLVRRDSTLVVSVAEAIPTLLLVKGDFSLKPPSPAPPAPKGFVIYGGGGFARFADAVANACGTVADCGGDDVVGAYTGGASFWITKWLALDGGYTKPSKATAEGAGSGFAFDSETDVHVITAGAKIGVPFSRLRIYANGGGNFHRATTTTVQTIGAASQTIAVKTDGFGWQAGGGIEVWATKSFALYAEANKVMLDGKPRDGTEGDFKDSLSVAVIGVRIRLF